MEVLQKQNNRHRQHSPQQVDRRKSDRRSKLETHLIKPHIISKVRIEVQPLVPSVRRPPPAHVSPKDMYNPMLDLLRNICEVHVVPGAGRTLHLEVVAVVLVETLQRLNEEEINREPYNADTSHKHPSKN